jgi:hypothetical protein
MSTVNNVWGDCFESAAVLCLQQEKAKFGFGPQDGSKRNYVHFVFFYFARLKENGLNETI